MANAKKRSRTALPDSLQLCDEPGVEDGADPRVFFRKDRQSVDHKARRLCGAVHRRLSLCLSSMLDDEAVRGLGIESVEPAPSLGRLLVVLRADRRLDPESRGYVLQVLESARGALRAEIGWAINRRLVPELRFLVLGSDEARS
jgi:ribosome-binding factor A